MRNVNPACYLIDFLFHSFSLFSLSLSQYISLRVVFLRRSRVVIPTPIAHMFAPLGVFRITSNTLHYSWKRGSSQESYTTVGFEAVDLLVNTRR